MKPAQEHWLLRLYVAGQTWRSATVHANLRRLCDEYLQGRYRIDVIDLVESPLLARTHEIVAVPAVVREAPVPFRKVIGDLADARRALLGLDFPL
jgi:circadian clock protein KaiB